MLNSAFACVCMHPTSFRQPHSPGDPRGPLEATRCVNHCQNACRACFIAAFPMLSILEAVEGPVSCSPAGAAGWACCSAVGEGGGPERTGHCLGGPTCMRLRFCLPLADAIVYRSGPY